MELSGNWELGEAPRPRSGLGGGKPPVDRMPRALWAFSSQCRGKAGAAATLKRTLQSRDCRHPRFSRTKELPVGHMAVNLQCRLLNPGLRVWEPFPPSAPFLLLAAT